MVVGICKHGAVPLPLREGLGVGGGARYGGRSALMHPYRQASTHPRPLPKREGRR